MGLHHGFGSDLLAHTFTFIPSGKGKAVHCTLLRTWGIGIRGRFRIV